MKNCRENTDAILFAALAMIVLIPGVAGAQADASPSPIAEPSPGENPAPVGDEEEEIVDLDSLEEQEAAGAKTPLIPDEPLLPVTITEMEIVKQPMLKPAALVLLVPVAAMLFRPKRKKRAPKRVAGDRFGDGKEH